MRGTEGVEADEAAREGAERAEAGEAAADGSGDLVRGVPGTLSRGRRT
jgi:hypothetical protein